MSTKPVISQFSQVASLLVHEYERYLPTAFDESLSLLEKVNKIIQKLNEIGLVTNDVINQWNEVMEWVMADGLTESVNNRLDEMVADGTLDAIINQNIFNDLNRKIDERMNSVENYNIIVPESDDTGRIQRAIDDSIGKVLHFPFGKVYQTQRLNLRDSSRLIIESEINASSLLTTELFLAENISNISVIGNVLGNLIGNTSETLTAIQFEGVTDFIVSGLQISNFKNKGIAVADNCKNGNVFDNFISGSNGSTGAGISLFGSNCERVNVHNNHVKTSRIGITCNGGREHNISDNQLYDNTLAGIMLDGIVSGSGDGTKSSIVDSNIVTGTTSTSYAGIYMGNGASYNVISNNVSNDNARSGIRFTGGSGYQGRGNRFIGNTVKGNAYHGFEFSWNEQMVLNSNVIDGNTQRGIAAIYSDESIVCHNQIRNNLQQGILWQSGKSLIQGNKCKNNDVGIDINYGGSTPTGNTIADNDCEFNTTSQTTYMAGNIYKNNRGFVSEAKGINVQSADGVKTVFNIPHGLPNTPTFASVIPNHATVNGAYSVTLDATNIIVTFATAPANVVNGAKFIWKAEL